ncbi:RNA-directed DNA polymerase, eukaryota, reverse transcriptase zinc-binding domain protein, partial [Tanacetum coccineum]
CKNTTSDPHDDRLKKEVVTVLTDFVEASKFVKHFEQFLGKVDHVKSVDESIFKNTLNSAEANNMICDVCDREIKEAMFDIDSNKASEPDGFTSEFFKRAWSIVGIEVCLAIKEFFKNGKLLGEINSTLIAPIPKINTPSKVSDFRPIACCNVIYKCISKILTNRIKSGLEKVVHINQSTFIPGRHIQDNILIAQELLRGYNRKNGLKRCAMQIDIQKSYDTVSWSFLEDILGKFRGLRQRDPLSPYLFTLVMEVFSLIMEKNIEESKVFGYHFGCKELKLSHMCFADDLLVLCKGNRESIEVVKKSLEDFSQVSGVPLLAKKLGVGDCKVLIDKMYWASVYLLPATVINDLDKLFKRFLWNVGDSAKDKARVFWKVVCRPKDQGGLGIKSLKNGMKFF